MLFPLKDHNPTRRWPVVTLFLIGVNVAVTVWTSTLPEQKQLQVLVEHGFVPARIKQLDDPNLVVEVKVEEEREVRLPGRQAPANAQPPAKVIALPADRTAILASVFSTMFLHAGWLHLLGNVWFLWIFGNNVEDRLGSIGFTILYFLGGLLATACHWIYDPSSTIPVVGASGAVSCVLGAYAVTFPTASVKTLIFLGILTIIDVPALLWLGFWFGGQLLTAVVFGQDLGVAVWAHIGGFVAGAVLMPIFSIGAPPPGGSWEDELAKHFTFPKGDWK
jgi:membrane associated rhomboid family serine protease